MRSQIAPPTSAEDSPHALPGVLPGQMSLSSDAEQGVLLFYRRLEQARHLTRPPPRSENRIVRFLDHTFQPEVIHFRKVDVSCSLVTAVKRNNPLCLLNPIVFNLSW